MNIYKIATKLASILPWSNINNRKYFDNGFMQVNGKTSRSEMTGFEREYIQITCPDLVHIAAVTNNNEIIIVNQFRHGIDNFVLELPGGSINKGESPAIAAARELSEETGYVSNSWEFLGELYVQPAVHSNKVYMFLARDIILTEGKAPDKGEELEVIKIPAGEVINMCKNGGIMHPFSQSVMFQLVEIL